MMSQPDLTLDLLNQRSVSCAPVYCNYVQPSTHQAAV